LLVGAFGKIIGWCVKMEDSKSNKKLVGLAMKQCAKEKGGYVVSTFMKLLDFSSLPFQIQS